MLGICLLLKQYCVNRFRSDECIGKWVMDVSSLFNGIFFVNCFGDNAKDL